MTIIQIITKKLIFDYTYKNNDNIYVKLENIENLIKIYYISINANDSFVGLVYICIISLLSLVMFLLFSFIFFFLYLLMTLVLILAFYLMISGF